MATYTGRQANKHQHTHTRTHSKHSWACRTTTTTAISQNQHKHKHNSNSNNKNEICRKTFYILLLSNLNCSFWFMFVVVPHSFSVPRKTHQITQFIFSITCQFVCLMPDYSIRLDSIRFKKGLEKSISFASSKQNVPSLDALTRPLDLRTALKREWWKWRSKRTGYASWR